MDTLTFIRQDPKHHGSNVIDASAMYSRLRKNEQQKNLDFAGATADNKDDGSSSSSVSKLQPSFDAVKSALVSQYFDGTTALTDASELLLDEDGDVDTNRDILFRHFSRLSHSSGSGLKSLFGAIGDWMSVLSTDDFVKENIIAKPAAVSSQDEQAENNNNNNDDENNNADDANQTQPPTVNKIHSLLIQGISGSDTTGATPNWIQICTEILNSSLSNNESQSLPEKEKVLVEYISQRVPKVAELFLGLLKRSSLSTPSSSMPLILNWASSSSSKGEKSSAILSCTNEHAIVSILLVLLGWRVYNNNNNQESSESNHQNTKVQCLFCGACDDIKQFASSSSSSTQNVLLFFRNIQSCHAFGICSHTFPSSVVSSSLLSTQPSSNVKFESTLKSFSSSPASSKNLKRIRQRNAENIEEDASNNSNDDTNRSLQHVRDYFQLFGDFVFHVEKLSSSAEIGNCTEFEKRLGILGSQTETFNDFVFVLHHHTTAYSQQNPTSANSSRNPLKNAIDYALTKNWINAATAKTWKDLCGFGIHHHAMMKTDFKKNDENNSQDPPSIFDSTTSQNQLKAGVEKTAGVIRKRQDDEGADEETTSNDINNESIKKQKAIELLELYQKTRTSLIDEFDEDDYNEDDEEQGSDAPSFLDSTEESKIEDSSKLFPLLYASTLGEQPKNNNSSSEDDSNRNEDAAQKSNNNRDKQVDLLFQQVRAFTLKCPPSQGVCPFDVTADCPDGPGKCLFKHVPCKNGNNCKRADCYFGHTKQRTTDRFQSQTAAVPPAATIVPGTTKSAPHPPPMTTGPLLGKQQQQQQPALSGFKSQQTALNASAAPWNPAKNNSGVLMTNNNTHHQQQKQLSTGLMQPPQPAAASVSSFGANSNFNKATQQQQQQQQKPSSGLLDNAADATAAASGLFEAPLFKPPLLADGVLPSPQQQQRKSGGNTNNNTNSKNSGGLLDDSTTTSVPLNNNNKFGGRGGGRGGRGGRGRGNRGRN